MSNQQVTRVFTGSFSTAFTISKDDNVTEISLKVGSGATCNVQGNFRFQGADSTAASLSEGDTLTLSAKSQSPLDGITITPSGGSVLVVITF